MSDDAERADDVIQRVFEAVEFLRVEEDDVRARLLSAVTILAPLGEESFPESLRQDYRQIVEQSTKHEAQYDEGRIEATMKRIKNSIGSRIANRVLQLYSDLQDIRTRGAFAVMRAEPNGKVYYIQRGENGPIKVGFSKNPKRRLAELQTGSGEPLRILAVIPGNRNLEREIHRRLERCKGHREWYKPEASDLEYLQRLMNVQYEVSNGRAYAVLPRARDDEPTDPCPFCFVEHQHGLVDGHRVAHCTGGWEAVAAGDGTLLEQTAGYIIKTRSGARGTRRPNPVPRSDAGRPTRCT